MIKVQQRSYFHRTINKVINNHSCERDNMGTIVNYLRHEDTPLKTTCAILHANKGGSFRE